MTAGGGGAGGGSRAGRLGVAAALSGGRLVPGDCEVADGRIVRCGLAGGAGRGIAAPGFVDLHVNGFAGVDFASADAADYADAAAAMAETGVVAFGPAFITDAEDALIAAIRQAASAGAAATLGGAPRARILGAHLEGPFLAPDLLRVHPAAHRRDPDAALLARLLDAGRVGQVTLAPELPGALDLVDLLVARGITVAAGHSGATADQAHAAFDRGVRTVVHLLNAMPAPAAREPGLAGAALARRDVTVQLIADGLHVAPDTARMVHAAARGGLILTTDGTAASGAPDGGYRLGPVAITRTGGAVRDATGRLAGSALTLDRAVRNLHAWGVPLPAALHAASTAPARLAGLDAPPGVVVLDDRLEVLSVHPWTPSRRL